MSGEEAVSHVDAGTETHEAASENAERLEEGSSDQQVADEAPSSSKIQGTVKWFSVNKGFGFVQPNDGSEEVFVHQTSIRAEGFRSLKEGEEVEYDLEMGEDGRGKAINVTGPQGRAPEGAPRRLLTHSAPSYAIVPQPYYGFHPDPYGYAPPIFRGGRFPGRFPMPGRGGFPYGGRHGFGPAMERPPPPGTPGVSSGYQVVVHNLPWSVTWQELKDVFSHTPGIQRADVIIDSAGRSRGFGTVRYRSREEAAHAAEMMNNTDIGGRIVTVRIDRFA